MTRMITGWLVGWLVGSFTLASPEGYADCRYQSYPWKSIVYLFHFMSQVWIRPIFQEPFNVLAGVFLGGDVKACLLRVFHLFVNELRWVSTQKNSHCA